MLTAVASSVTSSQTIAAQPALKKSSVDAFSSAMFAVCCTSSAMSEVSTVSVSIFTSGGFRSTTQSSLS